MEEIEQVPTLVGPEKLPCYREKILEVGHYTLTVRVESALAELSKYNSYMTIRAISKPKMPPTHLEQQMMRSACDAWIRYWCGNRAYINELRTTYLPPLPNTPPDELTSSGLRKVVTSTGAMFVSEISRLWLLSRLNTKWMDQNWKLDDTIQDFWVEDWIELETNPRSLELPSEAMEKLRADNEARRRKQESEGAQDAEIEKETPDMVFKNALDNFKLPEKKYAPITQILREAQRKQNLLWYRPVNEYSMRNLYDAVMLLTERINDYPYHNEIHRFIDELLCRLGCFFAQPQRINNMDMERYRIQAPGGADCYKINRDFQMWSTAYFFELIQRCNYWKYMSVNTIHRGDIYGFHNQADTLRNIVVRICEEMGRDEFYKLYKVCTEQQYDFPGDEMYSSYMYSGVGGGVIQKGDLLLKLRPERQAAKFFTEQNVNIESILSNIYEAETHLDRLCVFHIIDRYLFMYAGVKWMDNSVISQGALELNMPRIVENSIPCILHIFSRPCMHYDRKVFCSDNVYEVIVAWMLYIREYKNGMLFITNISTQIRELLGEDTKLLFVKQNTPAAVVQQQREVTKTKGRLVIEPL
jgi:hypothetical protein